MSPIETGVLPPFVPFAQAFAAVLTTVLTDSLYYVAASPKDPTYVVAPVLQSPVGRQDLKKLFEVNAASSITETSNGLASTPSSITPIAATDHQRLVSGLSGTSVSHSAVNSSTIGVEPSTIGVKPSTIGVKPSIVVTVSTALTTVVGNSRVDASSFSSKMPPIVENQASDELTSVNQAPIQDMEIFQLKNLIWNVKEIMDRIQRQYILIVFCFFVVVKLNIVACDVMRNTF